jgi:PAS domain-containing protein
MLFNNIFADIVALLSAFGGLAVLIIFLIQRKRTGKSMDANTLKTEKEVEQIEQEIEAKYVIHVKKWLDDLQEIKDKHDKEINEKNRRWEELHKQYLDSIKIATEHQQRLTQFHRATRRLLVSIDIPYWECDSNGKLVYANGAWLKLFGLSSSEALGEGWLNSIPEADRKSLLVDWYSKVVDQADGSITFSLLNQITGKLSKVKALYVILFNEAQEIDKILGVTIELEN